MTGRQIGQLGVPIGVVGIVLLLVVPLPAGLLDILIAVNITGALVILLTSMYVRRPLDFAVFPSLVLVATLFRLGLNVASTRLVLSDGYAGKVIDAFGHFVVSGSLIIGLVIFSILVVIQFVVITNGAGRVAEVGARFTLDAMPGKQMAIDADLNAGLVDEDEARQRRKDVAAEADFYGAMDGATKFVKGDAIAGIVITLINLIAGFAVGMLQRGMSAGESLETYSLLTVGDGLVTQIPALLMSVSTGLIVTRATTQGDMGTDTATQLTQNRQALLIAGTAAIAIALIPGLPKLPFVLMGGSLILVAQRAKRSEDAEAAAKAADASTDAAPQPDTPDSLMAQMQVDPLEIMLAPDLVDLVDTSAGGDLLERVRGLRRKVAMELGVVIPPVRTRDSIDLPVSTYALQVGGVEVGRGIAPPRHVLALGDDLAALPGRATTEPVFGLPGKWVPMELRHQAEMLGATVVDRSSVLITHLAEAVRAHAPRLLSREDVRALVDVLKRTSPALVEELVPSHLTLGDVQRVLQSLLEEGVSIRDLGRIFEGLSAKAPATKEVEALVEAARLSLGPALASQYSQDGVLRVISLNPLFEQHLAEQARPSETGTVLVIDPHRAEAMVGEVASLMAAAENAGLSPVLVCAPGLRGALRRMVAVGVPGVPVLSYTEVGAPGIRIETVGTVNGVDTAVTAGN